MNKSGPLNETDRILSLDIMRGLALLGILLANSLHFQYGLFLVPDIHNYYPLGTIDQIAEGFIRLFASASFYTLFSFLFGYGMAFLKERLEAANQPLRPLYWRRTVILLIVGFLHGTFIWDGDILFVYALAAFILYFFLKLKERGLLISSFLLLFIMSLSIATPEDDSMTLMDEQLLSYSIEEKQVLSTGTYFDIVSFRLFNDPLGLGWVGELIIHFSSMLSVLGMFLLGAYVARKKWLIDVSYHRPFLIRLWWITLIVGFPSKIMYVLNDRYAFEMLHATVGGPLVAMFYALSIVLLSSSTKGRQILYPLSYVGRLSLTNYLLQSIVFTTLFYSYGFNLFNRIGIFFGVVIAFAFFFLQVLLSKWWLQRFYIGPFEWVWRAGTYLKIPKLRRR
ncbi:DUF418 domain-containing protein [Halalkalibacter akibai]|uniref:DUF418 domain-containing protein n=1 Tax=Halalkalibacter akibai (strain ATCC 43226 / DSM 21942 / CIP 109018 / JCM 9157 / 1139) TaxID=1236973 RepID=W4QZV2_HALA3|nr:DUF418 domain-containing protein [Halalkalibacter akibai]GAE37407.1 hypothetical protein JCM9157_4706 [Halalkalibacter akibai JCM 9157]